MRDFCLSFIVILFLDYKDFIVVGTFIVNK